MNAPVGLSPRDDGARAERRMEAAGAVDAQTASTHSLENATRAFPTAPTRKVFDMIENKKTVTHVAGQICYLGRRPDNR